MNVIKGDFPRRDGGSDVKRVLREQILAELAETGFHRPTAERVSDLLSEKVAARIEEFTEELVFQVQIQVDSRTSSPQDVTDAVSEAWRNQIQSRLESIGVKAQIAICSAALHAVTVMARSDQL